ncbi:MAG: hypothetical protein COW19_01495 [Zetaproteobacteria bacterium CG12_big_fil_rev_8_21_14_0_65_55_1124]|nr:MAG: hypothetical protein AUJ58_06720 [Zetaproteobacteria bacterium CG1_02_55_237]PIS19110.1 MAG: hypothetical protein COT53_07290 [Zetaproteobacteria bacterium CG08_land_8_20_14_0_20_55_17]PIW43703.1 MAG: hypothetical protein COW19_01495 [Zetaproteobacteria bacterium CG12_big_fil_rev_8_21_14_0_65_55_1124]PIY53122.1 MAG: hypothetical protein COZ01_05010 [Zetaproteobacteria bacterium CG_4_10_14_0_8_um_filter_55_43]PIZ38563.1 MAG: hypothetical protein COY36_05875 [Zetaproteobacteria bacterium 
MADDTNIDDILKSIDALLKEGEAEDDRGQKDKRRRDTATNDDEIDANIEAATPDITGDEAGDELQASQDEQHEDELQQAADAADMDDHPTNLPVEADTEEVDVPPEAQPSARRIVLSEDMQVESTPDLPLAFSVDDESVEEQADDVHADASVELTEAETVFVHAEPLPAEDVGDSEFETVADVPSVDAERLIEQITAEVNARLQEELPVMLNALLAEVVRKHVAQSAEPSGDI